MLRDPLPAPRRVELPKPGPPADSIDADDAANVLLVLRFRERCSRREVGVGSADPDRPVDPPRPGLGAVLGVVGRDGARGCDPCRSTLLILMGALIEEGNLMVNVLDTVGEDEDGLLGGVTLTAAQPLGLEAKATLGELVALPGQFLDSLNLVHVETKAVMQLVATATAQSRNGTGVNREQREAG